MRATVIETLPGGLLDVLRAGSPSLPGLDDLRSGRAQKAAYLLRIAEQTPVVAAWTHLAERAAALDLPDGSALAYEDLVDPRSAWPVRPERPPADHPDALLCRLLELVALLRDLRGMLPPLSSPEVSPRAALLHHGLDEIESLRGQVLTGWPGLEPHLQLLAADLAARCSDPVADELLWQARDGFGAHGAPASGLAACALVSGDWLAAPCGSPATWGLALARPTSADSSLPSSLEDHEQTAPFDLVQATTRYDEAESGYRAAGDQRGLAMVMWRRSYLHYLVGRPDFAVAAADEAVVALEAAGDDASALVARAHGVLAGLADGRMPAAGPVAEPIVAWGRAISLSHAIGVGSMFVRAGRHWASVDLRPERAIAAFEIAEAIWAGLGRSVSRSQTVADQAGVLSRIGARGSAVLQATRAVDVDDAPLREPADPMDVRRQRATLLAAELYNLANAAQDTAGMARAQTELDRAVAPFRTPAPSWTAQQAAVAGQMVGLAATLGQQVMSEVFRAQAARERDDAVEAAEHFAAAENALERAPADEMGLLRAIVLAFQLRMEEAAVEYRAWLPGRLAAIADAQAQAADATSAELMATYERQIRDQALMFGLRSGDGPLAREQLDRLRDLADPWWAGLGTAWEHEEAVGRLYEIEGDLDAAAETFARAVDTVETVRAELRRDDLKQAFGAERTVQQLYRNAARVELRRRETALSSSEPEQASRYALEALRLIDQGRNRALADLLGAPDRVSRGADDDGSLIDLLRTQRGASAEFTVAQDRLTAALRADTPDAELVARRRQDVEGAREVVLAAENEMRTRDPGFWRLTAGIEAPPNPAYSVDLLADGHAVLVFSLDRPDFLACGVTADGVVAAHWSREERRIGPLVDRLVDACRYGEPWYDVADRLAEILLDPLAAALDGAREVFVVASGPTLRIPFAALPWRGEPLGTRVGVSMLPSLSTYPTFDPAAPGGSVLVVGNPAAMSYRRDSDDLPRPQRSLTAAALEAVAVARVHEVTPLLGVDATEQRVRELLANRRIAHLATHGVLDEDSPLASSILLANGDQLTVAELMGMRLGADLVVLSACDTGTGRSAGGDEVLGMARGLLAAGAAWALVTLWAVDDVSAALLMTRFHQEIAVGVPLAQALRAAVVWLRDLDRDQAYAQLDGLRTDSPFEALPGDLTEVVRVAVDNATRDVLGSPRTATPYRHPRHWAPFVLVGRSGGGSRPISL